jgi:hypothetical protein
LSRVEARERRLYPDFIGVAISVDSYWPFFEDGVGAADFLEGVEFIIKFN